MYIVLCDIIRGKSHICSGSKKFQNMAALLSSSDSASLDAEKFAAATISQKVSYKQGARAELTTPKNKSMVIKVNPSSSMVLLEGMSTIQNDLNLSTRMTNKLCKDLRQCSSSSIEPNIREKLHVLNHCLDDFFDVTEMNFEESGKRPVVICTDLNALIHHLFEQRGIANDSAVIIKFGIDSGGGYLKFCMNIIFQSENVLNKCHHKDSGIKQLIVVAIAPDIVETYINIKLIWITLKIDSLQRHFTVAADLKMCNIILGLMGHGSCHSCTWCDIHKEKLTDQGVSRTVGNLSKLFWEFYNSGETKSKAKNHGNAIHPSLINGHDDTLLIAYVPPRNFTCLLGLLKQFTIKWKLFAVCLHTDG